MAEKDRKTLRERLAQMLARVPASVSAGSHQRAVAFKHYHAAAIKVLRNERATAAQLESAINNGGSFYGSAT